MKRIYLDNAATTNIDPKVIEAMNKSHEFFGNPSSLHSFGQGARKLIDQSRDTVADFLNCKPTEVIFTSGGSESDNLAIKGLINALRGSFDSSPKAKLLRMTTKPHVVTSAIEHHAVLHTIQDLEKEGKIEATYVKPNKLGVIQTEDVKSAIKDNTILVSVMYVNNEVGTVQPIREIGKLIEKINLQRNKEQETITKQIPNNKSQITNKNQSSKLKALNSESKFSHKIYFHTDAVQAAEFFNMDTKYLHVDLLTLTAHKFHGPKGIGVLFIKKGTPIEPQIVGGDQEFRFRAGTENTSSIVGLAAAIKEVENQRPEIKNIEKLRNKLEDSILKNIPETYLNGDREKRSPAILNISFKNAEGEAIILNLDFLGIAVSSGSACTARSLDPSHVLMAMDIPRELSHGAIRFSLSRETTEDDINKVAEVLPNIIKKLREMSPFK
ncbi:MAG: cysteine desulfurase [Patescibacteria group bacterium]|nr:cysteine desulfurase [Patescibacteria group bacterium]